MLDITCCVHLHTLLHGVAQSFKPVKLYASHDALHVLTWLGVVVSVCTPLPTRTQQLPTLLAQQCWELLHPFVRVF